MNRYVVLDFTGTAVNTILWDGVTHYTLEEGFSLIPESEYVAPEVHAIPEE